MIAVTFLTVMIAGGCLGALLMAMMAVSVRVDRDDV